MAGFLAGQRAFVRALYGAARDYVPKPYTGRVIVYQATVQPLWYLLQVGAAWVKIAPLAEIVNVKGSHQTLFQERRLTFLAADLRQRMAALRLTTGDQVVR